jgi:hypothetical protein
MSFNFVFGAFIYLYLPGVCSFYYTFDRGAGLLCYEIDKLIDIIPKIRLVRKHRIDNYAVLEIEKTFSDY